MERLTVSEAAERLRISKEAVRKRIQRGTLPHAKRADGHVYVYLDSELNDIGQGSATRTEDALVLNYIDKLYTAWQQTSTTHKRYSFLALVIPVLVLALSGGAVSPGESLSVSGIGLKVPLAVLMLAGALLFPLLLVALMNVESLSRFYEDEIYSLYERLGLTEVAANSPVDPFLVGSITDVCAFGYELPPNPPESEASTNLTGKQTFEGRLEARGHNVLVAGFYLILPIAAQVGAGYKISELLSKREPGWFAEILASVGAFLGVVFSYLPLPHQSSDWVSNLFVLLAFITALVFTALVYGTSFLSAADSIRAKIFVVVDGVYLVGFCVIAGAWLGYWVAAS